MTAWLSALVIALLLLVGLGLGVAQVAVTQQQAQSIADHAALAAASGGCDLAERVVSAQASAAIVSAPRLHGCNLADGDARVQVAIPLPAGAARLVAWLGVSVDDVMARARAGSASVG